MTFFRFWLTLVVCIDVDEMCFQLFYSVEERDELAVIAPQESLALQVVEQCFQRLPEMAHVVDQHLLVVIAQSGLRCHGEHLVEGADATGQCHCHIAVLQHQAFALVERLAPDQFVDECGGVSAFLEDGGHYAHHMSACFMHGLCHALHQSHVATAIH